jgi:phospholipase/carboxylesterase
MTHFLETIVLNPQNREPKASIIWLHGLGADGHDFVPIVERYDLSDTLQARFIFPHAPIRPITINGGMRMRGWYDITDLEFTKNEDLVGIRDSQTSIVNLIEAEIVSGIPANRILLAGFSQGGAVALHTALRYPEALGGIIALSTYLPLVPHFTAERSVANFKLPIFLAHGLFDSIVPFSLGETTRSFLGDLGYKIDWYSYPMQHAVMPEEIEDIVEFMEKTLTIWQ